MKQKSGVDDSDSDTDGHCNVIWAKTGRGVWGLCDVFENTLYLNRALVKDSAVPSNLSISKVPESDRAAISAGAKKCPKARQHIQFFCMNQQHPRPKLNST